ncbi:MAG TPA: VOC family protein [Candidatus Binataceae bacterium]|nr:VOC family protein [Candidatus Binataceae bacterium]
MSKQPIGKLDHIGIAVKSIAEARKFYEGVLGATYMYEHDNPDAGFRYVEFDLAGTIIELLEPLREDSFMHKFIAEHGEGFHHMTFDVPDSRERVAELKAAGVRVVQEKEHSPTSYEAFISPRSSHGVLIQMGSGFPTLSADPEWEKVVPGLKLGKK